MLIMGPLRYRCKVLVDVCLDGLDVRGGIEDGKVVSERRLQPRRLGKIRDEEVEERR